MATAARRRQTTGNLALAPELEPEHDAGPPDTGVDEHGVPGWVRALDVAHQLCRGTAHDWEGIGQFYRAGPAFYVEIAQCRTCSTRRARLYGRTGELVDSGYSHPAGYLKPAGEEYEPVSRAEVRGHLFRAAPPAPITTRLREELAESFPRLGVLV